jgi:hypothetical protein
MATYYVWSGGSNTPPYNSWATAAVALSTAVSAASADNDVILVHYADAQVLTVDTVYTFAAANIQLYTVDKDNGDALTPMGTTGYLGSTTTNVAITFSGGRRVYIYGLTPRNASSGADNFSLNGGNGGQITYNSCYFWLGSTNTSSRITTDLGDANSFVRLEACTFRFGATAQGLRLGSDVEIIGGEISSAGSAITEVFKGGQAADTAGATVEVLGFDMSAAASTAAIVADHAVVSGRYLLRQCKLPSTPTYLATQTDKNFSSATLEVIDCAAGDTHGIYGYYAAVGSFSTDFTITYDGEPSWKIETTADASPFIPFVTPWVGLHNTTLSSLTPRFEILRDGSTSAFQDDEVWAEFAAKVTTGSTNSTLFTDRMAPLGTPTNLANGSGLTDWAGESGTAWSGKIDSGASISPAEEGPILGRILVGEPSTTVYISPRIRV